MTSVFYLTGCCKKTNLKCCPTGNTYTSNIFQIKIHTFACLRLCDCD